MWHSFHSPLQYWYIPWYFPQNCCWVAVLEHHVIWSVCYTRFANLSRSGRSSSRVTNAFGFTFSQNHSKFRDVPCTLSFCIQFCAIIFCSVDLKIFGVLSCGQKCGTRFWRMAARKQEAEQRGRPSQDLHCINTHAMIIWEGTSSWRTWFEHSFRASLGFHGYPLYFGHRRQDSWPLSTPTHESEHPLVHPGYSMGIPFVV